MSELLIVLTSVGIVVAMTFFAYVASKAMCPMPLFHTTAGIASALVPHVSKYPPKDGRIWVVGANGGYVCHNPDWADALSEWMDNGNKIEYLLIDPSPETLRVLNELLTKYKELLSVFTVFTKNAVADDRTKSLISKYETFHFVLFDSPRQIWIEGNHPRGDCQAYSCEYVPPWKARTDSRFDLFLNNYSCVRNVAQVYTG